MVDRYPPHWRIVLGVIEGEWRKGVAVTAALWEARGSVVVMADADIWSPGVLEAVEMIHRGHRWVVPQRLIFRLNEAATARVLAGAEPDRCATKDDVAERPYIGWMGGGCLALAADAAHAVPIDSRFAGWGCEDEAWAVALKTLEGHPRRISQPLWHLWHPPQDRPTRSTGSEASEALLARYHAAHRDPRSMAELVEEGRWTRRT